MVWTDNGKQFTLAVFVALMRTMLPWVRHRQIPPYVPYAGGWNNIKYRALLR